MTLLDVNDLSVRYETDEADVHAVRDASFSIESGETFGLVGESGCGKTTLGKSLLQLLDDNGRIHSGEVWVDSVIPKWQDENGNPSRDAIEDESIPVREDGMMDLTELSTTEIQQVRWNVVSLIPQSAMNALNPVYKVGDQIVEAIQLHNPGTSEAEARERALELVETVGIEPERADDYAHELSGGMRQRAVIAMSMACDPDLVVADEPTTALDVITQDRVLDAVDTLQSEVDASMLIISHDISVMAETCDRLAVMYGGHLVESGTVADVLDRPAHPYTLGLENSFPRVEGKEDLLSIPGTPPTLRDPEDECPFVDRCPFAVDECTTAHPETEPVSAHEDEQGEGSDPSHVAACYRLDILDEMRERASTEETWKETQTPR